MKLQVNFYRVTTDIGDIFLKMPEKYFRQFLDLSEGTELTWEIIDRLPAGAKFYI
jgi:hypothetical protein